MNLLRFDGEPAWIETVCALWRDRLRTNPALRMCLPSGTTPAPIYAEMSRGARAGLVSFARAAVFALDEFGGLAPDDPGRTRQTLQHQLLDAVDLPPGAFHTLDPEAPDLTRHLAAFDAGLRGGIDLMILGIGLNGHLGMNEPGSDEQSPTRRVDLHDSTIQSSARYFTHAQLPTWGVTVGLQAILASKEVWLLANGQRKAEIVRDIVEGEVTPAVPASLLRRHPNCSLFVDAEAGAFLNLPQKKGTAPIIRK